jgi:hypothetical protein
MKEKMWSYIKMKNIGIINLKSIALAISDD